MKRKVFLLLTIFFMMIFSLIIVNKKYWRFEGNENLNYENKMVSILVDGEEVNSFPDRSESRYQGTTCSNNESASFDEEAWKLTIPDITSSTRCTISFISEGHLVKVRVDGGHADEASKAVDHNGNVTFLITPQDNYHMYSGITCEGKGTTLFANNVLTVREVKSDITCNITYTTSSYNVTMVTNNGSISKSTLSVARGGSDEATLTPNEHFTVREAVIVCDPGITGTLNDQTNKARVTNVYTSGVCTVTLACDDGLYTGESQAFDYTGSEQTFYACKDKKYKLEVWGAQGGGSISNSIHGGYGGYSTGIFGISTSKTIYINVGGAGGESTIVNTKVLGGYNGGGPANKCGVTANLGNTCTNINSFAVNVGSGGGATHIASVTGLLYNLSSNHELVYVVSGGGGGTGDYNELTNRPTFNDQTIQGDVTGMILAAIEPFTQEDEQELIDIIADDPNGNAGGSGGSVQQGSEF